MHKREIFNTAAYFSGFTSLLRKYKKLFTSELPILAYHRVISVDDNNFTGDIELVSSYPEEFEKQLKYICKHYKPITFRDLYQNTTDHDKGLKPPIILTFDDGFKDNYDIVFPLLKKYNAKATFFVVTNVVDEVEPLWFETLAHQIITSKIDNISFKNNDIYLGRSHNNRRAVIANLLLNLRTISNIERIEILNEISKQLSPSDKFSNYDNYLSWNDIREMHSEGMEFGSHSRSHPILASMNNDDILNELLDSKVRLENELKSECISFSYPVGGFEEYNSYALTALRECNYKFACTYEPGINNLPLKDAYQLRRIHVERYTSKHTFKNIITSSIFSYK